MSRDALVVGINTYDRLKSLNAPAADGEAIAQILQQDGEFQVTRLPAVKDKENQTIRIGKQTKVSLTQLERAIVQLFKPDLKRLPPILESLPLTLESLPSTLKSLPLTLESLPPTLESLPSTLKSLLLTLKPLPEILHLI